MCNYRLTVHINLLISTKNLFHPLLLLMVLVLLILLIWSSINLFVDIIEDIIHHSTFYQNNSSQIYIQKLFLTTCKHGHTLYILKNICDYISLSIYLSFYLSKRRMSQQMPTEIYIDIIIWVVLLSQWTLNKEIKLE